MNFLWSKETRVDLKLLPVFVEHSEVLKRLSFLSFNELQEYYHFPTVKRQSEWLAGRVAGKVLIAQHLSEQCPTIERSLHEVVFSPSRGERPRVNVNHVAVSISHSEEQVCAAIVKTRSQKLEIGVDLEKARPIDFDLLPVAFSESEQKWILREPWRYYQFWTAKEALLKTLGIGLTVDLRTVLVKESLGMNELTLEYNCNTYRVMLVRKSDYFISVCVLKSGC